MKAILRPFGAECRIVTRCLLSPSQAPSSKLAFLIGLSYLFSPIDVISDHLPYIGHLDEVGFVLAGLIGARLLAPPALLAASGPAADAGSGLAALWFAIRVLRADLANFSLFQYRAIDGFLVTGKNSGTHWVKYMLSVAIAHEYGVAPPEHSSGPASNTIIGHPSRPPADPRLPRIGSTHTIPSIAFGWRWRLFAHPPVVVLVRDINEALLSNYVKWRNQYDCSFSTYLRGDPSGRRFVADIWWYMHFFNRWGRVARAWPQTTLIVHYEDMVAAPAYWLRRIAAHLHLDLSERSITAALPFTGRRAVAAQLDPQFAEVIIPATPDRQQVSFTPADTAVLEAMVLRHLRFGLGYNYKVPGQPGVDQPGLPVMAAAHKPLAS